MTVSKYRGYRIDHGLNPIYAKYEFAHEDYDGAPDAWNGALDPRCGYGNTLDECWDKIDQLIDELEETHES